MVKAAATVPTEKLTEEPYASIVCYPKATLTEIENRINELQTLGVSALEFAGKGSAANIPVLGKGYVGIVVAAHVNGQRVALKIRRIDADRVNLGHEAEMLQKANSVDVGAKFLAVSTNFLLMQLIEGDLFEAWLTRHMEKPLVKKVVAEILEQCWRLDEAGLDHGELSKAPKHLLVNNADKPFIVDFETASTNRKVANVTSVCQFLYMGNSNTAKLSAQAIGERNMPQLTAVLKNYKKNRNRINFETLLSVCLI